MAAISRVLILHHPSVIFSRPLHHQSARPQILVHSSSPLLCSSSPSSSSSTNPPIVGELLRYLNESWTQFHATAEAKRQLIAAGFHLLNENDEWDLKPGGRYFFTRNMSCLVAFAIGEKDLIVAGRVIVRISDGSFLHKLVKVKRPLLRVPTLAIHLNSTVNTDGFKPNLETHFVPLLARKPEEAPAESKEKKYFVFQGCSSSTTFAEFVR